MASGFRFRRFYPIEPQGCMGCMGCMGSFYGFIGDIPYAQPLLNNGSKARDLRAKGRGVEGVQGSRAGVLPILNPKSFQSRVKVRVPGHMGWRLPGLACRVS